MLWDCWLSIRKSIWPIKNQVMRCWCGYLSRWVICIWSSWCQCRPIISCFIKIETGLTFLVPGYLGCTGKEAIKQMSVCLSYCVILLSPCNLKEKISHNAIVPSHLADAELFLGIVRMCNLVVLVIITHTYNKIKQGSAVAHKPTQSAASRRTCCKQIRWMLSVINLRPN